MLNEYNNDKNSAVQLTDSAVMIQYRGKGHNSSKNEYIIVKNTDIELDFSGLRSLNTILLLATTCRGSSITLRTEPTLLINLCSLWGSDAFMMLPQQNTTEKIALATKDSQNMRSMFCIQ